MASKNVEVDTPSTGLNILSFLIPLVGLILFLSWQNTTPIKAKAVGKWALIGFCVAVGLSIIEPSYPVRCFPALLVDGTTDTSE